LALVINNLAKEHSGATFIFVDVNKLRGAAQQYHVTETPTLICLIDGVESEKFSGTDESKLNDMLKRHSTKRAAAKKPVPLARKFGAHRNANISTRKRTGIEPCHIDHCSHQSEGGLSLPNRAEQEKNTHQFGFQQHGFFRHHATRAPQSQIQQQQQQLPPAFEKQQFYIQQLNDLNNNSGIESHPYLQHLANLQQTYTQPINYDHPPAPHPSPVDFRSKSQF
jgi:hypothetical protein